MMISNAALADEVVLLDKGAVAPFKGLLFSPQKSEKVYQELETLKEKQNDLERILALYKENEFLYDRKVNTLLEQNMNLTDTLTKVENHTELNKIIWFGLGILSVGLGIYATKAVSPN